MGVFMNRVIKLIGLFSLIAVGIFASSLTIIEAQSSNPQPIVFDTGKLPLKALLASEPLRLHLAGPLTLSYEASGSETISIYVRSLADNAAPLDTLVEVDDPDGNPLAFNDDMTSDTRDAGVENVSLPGAGTYLIRVDTYDLLDGGGVEVQLVTSAAPEVSDQSSILDVNGKLNGNGPVSFTFNGSAGQIVTITVQAINPPSSDMDLSMTLYAPDGSEAASDDDSGGSNGLGELDPALMHFSLPQTGEYKLEVNSWFDTPGDIAVKVTSN
jgi:pre-peptidase